MAADTTKSGIGCFGVVLWGAALIFGGILALIPAVGPILGVAVLVGAGVLHWQMNRVDPAELEEYRARKAGERPGTLASHAVVADPLRSAAVPRSPSVPPVHIPPSPSGVAVEPWSQTRSAIEVVGEAYRDEAFRRLFQGVRISDYDGADMTLLARWSTTPGTRTLLTPSRSGSVASTLDISITTRPGFGTPPLPASRPSTNT